MWALLTPARVSRCASCSVQVVHFLFCLRAAFLSSRPSQPTLPTFHPLFSGKVRAISPSPNKGWSMGGMHTVKFLLEERKGGHATAEASVVTESQGCAFQRPLPCPFRDGPESALQEDLIPFSFPQDQICCESIGFWGSSAQTGLGSEDCFATTGSLEALGVWGVFFPVSSLPVSPLFISVSMWRWLWPAFATCWGRRLLSTTLGSGSFVILLTVLC